MGHISTGGWCYLFAASLDLVDGRVARATGRASKAGAFLDSTLDRLAELAIFAGLAVHFRAGPALFAALGAASASVMVSYARARGEALGAGEAAKVGGMQRPERVVLTGLPCALAPLADFRFGAGAGDVVVGGALALLAVLTAVTAGHRFGAIWRALRAAEPSPRALPGRGERLPGGSNLRWLDAARRKRSWR
jgi:phosphatidylglycerophosphate synthase